MNPLQRKLNKKMDILIQRENSGQLNRKNMNRAIRRALQNKLALVGLGIFLTIIILCFFAPLFTQYDPLKINIRVALQSPSTAHVFGTDTIGRDIFSRILYGGRLSILIGFGSAVGASFLGVVIGAWAGYRGGWFDFLMLRTSELFLFFPQIILCLLLVTMVGQSVGNLLGIFIFTGWCGIFRMTRARMLSLREEEYVQALKVLGVPEPIICYKHILPNALGPVFVNITLSTAIFILQEAALSFMGLGVPLEIATWGNILNVANNLNILKVNWWIWLPVGTMISLFVLSINFIGDGLRDSTDPSQQG